MAVNFDPCHFDVVFTVYNGEKNKLPKTEQPLLLLLYDEKEIKIGKMIRSEWYVDDDYIRISIGDAWSVLPRRDDLKYYPQPKVD